MAANNKEQAEKYRKYAQAADLAAEHLRRMMLVLSTPTVREMFFAHKDAAQKFRVVAAQYEAQS